VGEERRDGQPASYKIKKLHSKKQNASIV